jgi:hypothetical protein
MSTNHDRRRMAPERPGSRDPETGRVEGGDGEHEMEDELHVLASLRRRRRAAETGDSPEQEARGRGGDEAPRRSRGGRRRRGGAGLQLRGKGRKEQMARVRVPGGRGRGGSLYTPSPTIGSNGRGRPNPTVRERGLGEAGHVGPGALSGRAACRATVPRWRSRPGPTLVPGWPVERRHACCVGLVSGFFGPFSCRPNGPGPSGQL